MKFAAPLIAVSDLDVSKAFYQNVMRQQITLDLGANVELGGAFAIQTNYEGLVGNIEVRLASKSNDHELYFEETDIDGFIAHLDMFPDIEYLHKVKEYPWGQRVLRFYDPDKHIIEVGESMESVFKRFHSQGMSVEEIAGRTWHPVEYVRKYFK
jgi:catechol 2,3-dioxygenase-like lactoylglutathione lyase family enzyme